MKKKQDSMKSLSRDELQKKLKRKDSALGRLKREVKIEAALEQVRTRTMAMQKSEELADVAEILFKQVQGLGIHPWSAGFNIWQEGNDAYIDWVTNPTGGFMEPYTVDLTSHSVFREVSDAKKRGDDFHVFEISGEPLAETYALLVSFAPKQFEGILASGIQFPARQINHYVFGAQVGLMFITPEPYPEAHDIFKRFGNVFEQTYTRFLDLQKAEAQARESQIQLALERVRAKTMAMQHSDDLKSAAALLFQQVKALGAPAYSCGYNIWEEEDKEFTSWMSNQDGSDLNPVLNIPLTEDANFIRYAESRKKGEQFFVLELRGERMQEHYRYLKTIPAFKAYFEYAEKAGFAQPVTQIHHLANFSQGNLLFITLEPCPEFHDVFKRFAAVFDQTYTRFLDLQRAEEQVREAQIEAALERVRSRSMGMQKSEELREIIQVIYEQFIQLGFNIGSAGFGMDYLESDDFNFWFADSSSTYPNKAHVPYFDHPQFNRFKEAREKGLDFYTSNLTFEEKNKFIDHVLKYSPPIPQELKEVFYRAPGYMSSHVVLKNIVLYILNYTNIPFSDAENAILMRFGKVFEQAYIRFNDLKQAEAQALEAINRASVDRVRAEIASMRTTSDLEKITPLVLSELTAVGVPCTRCGVFIMDEQQQEVNTFLSTPEGKAILAFRLPYKAHPEIVQVIAHWRKKEIYKPHWDEGAFRDWTRALMEKGAVTSGERYLTENRPTSLYLHFLPFLQGMLYVGNTAPLSDEHVQLVQALAGAFSTAYARYEDFNKLESAKEQIEKTLVDLRQTQAQLLQSEKMASLGELTAGIAHEIQNPLNFVNNFSEVNKELISEMKEELEKGNLEEVREMANQIGDNEEKILHHGKRADAIVKGMLLHSQSSTGNKEPTDINALADEYFHLAYHGLRAKDKSFHVAMSTDYDASIGEVPVIPQDISRVLLNLYNNAFYAVNEKKKGTDAGYEPRVSVSTRKTNGKVEIRVKDNGNGIPQKVRDKIFQPFFTTKPTGQGTGLGLSLSYDIVKAHGGEIKVDTREGEFTEFEIHLPVSHIG